jgi:hypothetical protein
MFTLFWAGERFAPQLMVDDDTGKKVNIQRFLQTHNINTMAELLKCLAGLGNIVGIGTIRTFLWIHQCRRFIKWICPFCRITFIVWNNRTQVWAATNPFSGNVSWRRAQTNVGEWSN